MSRKKKPEEHENHERWLVSYADFITLLFALFTTLYAISSVDAKKFGRMVLSMQAAFDPTGFASVKATSVNPTGEGGAQPKNAMLKTSLVTQQKLAPTLLKKRRKNPAEKGLGKGSGPGPGKSLLEIKEDISQLVVDDTLRDKIQIIIRGKGVIISLAEAGFFDSGQHMVRGKSLPLVEKISAYIAGLPNLVRVEGHSDDRPMRSTRFPSNWELSTARATYLVSYFIKSHHFDPKRLSAAGYAEYRPVDTNDTSEGRARNRRVDITILAAMDPDEDSEGM